MKKYQSYDRAEEEAPVPMAYGLWALLGKLRNLSKGCRLRVKMGARAKGA